MTVAICLKCGAFKHGAWTPCMKCGYRPDDDESYTKHLLVTDHYLSQEQLEEVSELVKSGGQVDFPEDVLQKSLVTKEMVEANAGSLGYGCGFMLIGFVALFFVLLGGLIYFLNARPH